MSSLAVRRFPIARRLSRIFTVIMMITIFSGMIILPFEMQSENALMDNSVDSMWWAITTVTTVGYGDIVPVTFAGRIIGAILQMCGIVMFGTLIGTITVYLDQVQEDYEWRRTHEQLDRIEEQINTLRHKTDYLIKNKDAQSNAQTPQRWRL